MARVAIAVVVGYLVTFILIGIGVWMQLRFTTFGTFVWVASQGSTEHLVREFGDPVNAMGNFAMVSRYVISPIAVLFGATVARLISRRATWTMSVLAALPVFGMNAVWMYGLEGVAAACFYILAAHLGVKAATAMSPRRRAIATG